MPQKNTPASNARKAAAPDPALRAKVEQMLDTASDTPDSPLPGRDPLNLPLPHERDQSVDADSTGGMGTGAAGADQREVLTQAHQDLKQGQVDTDLRATPGLDAERREALVDDPKARDERRRERTEAGTPHRH